MTYLSYSGFKSFSTCPYQYWHKYVNKTSVPTPENGVNALYGTVVGQVFEAFYRDRIWKNPNCVDALCALAEPTLDAAIRENVSKGRVVDWGDDKANYRTRKGVLDDVLNSIPVGVETIRSNRFIGPFTEAEMKLDYRFGSHIMGGRADFTIERVAPYKDLIILDGKGSKHRDKYVDGSKRKEGRAIEGTQLKWYAALYREHYGRTPDALGYVFWRFSGDKAVEWVPFEEHDLDRLKDDVLSTIDRIDRSTREIANATSRQSKDEIRQELFPAQPGYHCNLCAYAEVCSDSKKNTRRHSLPAEDDFSLGVEK